ncbi:conserved hypothetical protein [Candidatus Brocadia pituitae]|nr:conserved hypothetical protein [Candidatus Brocadia pituitae]
MGYGKDLQEFLLKYCHIKAIYDNQSKRSSEHADVNTIIAIFSASNVGAIHELPLQNIARFVMFKRPFEEVINTRNLLEIERANDIVKADTYRVFPVKQETLLEEGWEYPEDVDAIHELPKDMKTNQALPKSVGAVHELPKNIGAIRESPLQKPKQKALIRDKFLTGKYEGNKWGGKYLRAPDIFFTILEKGKGKLVRLGDIAEVRRGFTTGCNEFFYLPNKHFDIWKDGKYYELIPKYEGLPKGIKIEENYLKPLIKGPKDCNSIAIESKKLKSRIFICHDNKQAIKEKFLYDYIIWGENMKFHVRETMKNRSDWWILGDHKIPAFLIIKGPWLRHFVPINTAKAYCDQQVYEVVLKENLDIHKAGLIANSTLSALFFEIEGRSNFGEGILWLAVYEATNLLLLDPNLSFEIEEKIFQRKVEEIFIELGINPNLLIREQKPNPFPDRKALDDVVFDILGLTQDERNEVYWAVCELVKNRLDKAKSV